MSDDAHRPRTRRRVRRPAGPPVGGAPGSTMTAPTARPSSTTVPRKSSPVGKLRKATPAATAPVTTAPAVADSAVTTTRGAALGYRQRRTAGTTARSGIDRSRLGLLLAGGLGAVVLVALVVASTLFAVNTSSIDEASTQRAQYAAFARQMIVNLTSLSPTTIDTAVDTFQNDTSGKALQQLQDTMQQTTDLIKTQGVSTKGTILSDAVVDSDADSATVLIVSGWTMKNPAQQNPAPAQGSSVPPVTGDDTVVQTFRWKVVVTKINGAMKLTDIEWVT
ncbi:hypothetical protein [Williamsia herbipolensis]|uniref:hypothetical protein n=1 Tax=Williamsia herbipolensis TaxID=1603258 RepID=UPI0012372336|nr:hypothetical protein [Williamsia herbipolensis]